MAWVALAMFVIGTAAVVWIGVRYPDLSSDAVMTIWCWLAFGMVPVCVWYYGRTSTVMPRRGGSSDAQSAKGFFWGGWIWLGICALIAVGGAYGVASWLAILVGFNSLAIAAARRSTARTRSS